MSGSLRVAYRDDVLVEKWGLPYNKNGTLWRNSTPNRNKLQLNSTYTEVSYASMCRASDQCAWA